MMASDPAEHELYGDAFDVMRRVITAVDASQIQTSGLIPPGRDGALYYRAGADGREITVYPLVMGTVRLTVGDQGACSFDDGWCYAYPAAGLLAAMCWDGHGDPPEGWFRHLRTGRRRPAGDPAREYIQQ